MRSLPLVYEAGNVECPKQGLPFRLTIRLTRLIKVEARLVIGLLGFGNKLKSLLLPFDGRREVTGFRIGRSQRIDVDRLLPSTQFAGFGHQFNRLLSVATVFVRASCEKPSQAIVGSRRFRFEPHTLSEINNGLVVFASLFPNASASSTSESVVRGQPQCVCEVGNGLVELTFRRPRKAPPAVGARVVRIEPNGFAQVGDRLVMVTLLRPTNAPPAIGSYTGRIESNRLRKIGDGFVEFRFNAPNLAAVAIGPGIRWIQLHCRAEIGEGLFVFPFAIQAAPRLL